MEKQKRKQEKSVDRKVLTFFLLAFPTLLIIVLGVLYENAWMIQIFFAFYQFILLKQFLDDYYS